MYLAIFNLNKALFGYACFQGPKDKRIKAFSKTKSGHQFFHKPGIPGGECWLWISWQWVLWWLRRICSAWSTSILPFWHILSSRTVSLQRDLLALLPSTSALQDWDGRFFRWSYFFQTGPASMVPQPDPWWLICGPFQIIWIFCPKDQFSTQSLAFLMTRDQGISW